MIRKQCSSSIRWSLLAGAAAFVALAAPAPAAAEVRWSIGFENGELFGDIDGALYARGASVVTDPPAFEGSFSARMEITPQAIPGSNGHNRVEVKKHFEESAQEGTESFFGWSFMMPAPTQTHNDIGYFESDQSWSQRVAFFVDPTADGTASKLGGRINGSGNFTFDKVLQPGRWYRLVTHVVWSTDPTVGRVSAWLDGEQIVNNMAGKTKSDANRMFVQTGLHRNQREEPVEVIHLDSLVNATTFAEVTQPQLVAAADQLAISQLASADEGGCAVASPAGRTSTYGFGLMALLGLALGLRRRRS